MSKNQDDPRGMTIHTPLDGEKPLFRLMWFSGRESISRLFRYQLDIQVVNHRDKEVDFAKLLGEEVRVEMPLQCGGTRHFNGICAGIARGGSDQRMTSYTMEMVPKFWLLTRKANCRIFQKKSVPRIIKEILDQLNVDFEPLNSEADYPPRDYCVQYNETDAEFISRLMEEEGIFYYFQHTAETHKIVLMDSSAHVPAIPSPVKINYGGDQQCSRDDYRIFNWRKSQKLTPGKRVLRDYTMHKPPCRWEVERPIMDKVQTGEVEHQLKVRACKDLEIFRYPGEYAHRLDQVPGTDGERDRTAAVRSDQLAMPGLTIGGSSNCRHFMTGYTFINNDVLKQQKADGEYMLMGVEHSARPLLLKDGKPIGVEYHNSFKCIPIALKYRPPRLTRKPNIFGVQTARVVGPKPADPKKEDEIHVDEYGRVKVKFHWDRSEYEDARCSAWIRVGQGWASGGFGMHFWPRVGDEVIVAFENGDPDRPLIVGSVYNHDNKPPYPLSEHKTRSGIKTKSANGGDVHKHYNELRFEDKKGHEQIYLHAENNFDAVIESSETRKIGTKRQTSIGNEHEPTTETIEQKYVYGSQSSMTSQDDVATAKEMWRVGWDRNLIASQKHVDIEASNGKVTISALQTIELKVGLNSIKVDQAGVWIDGINLSLTGKLLATMHAPMANVIADGVTTVNAPATNILSTGPLVLKGAVAAVTY